MGPYEEYGGWRWISGSPELVVLESFRKELGVEVRSVVDSTEVRGMRWGREECGREERKFHSHHPTHHREGFSIQV